MAPWQTAQKCIEGAPAIWLGSSVAPHFDSMLGNLDSGSENKKRKRKWGGKRRKNGRRRKRKKKRKEEEGREGREGTKPRHRSTSEKKQMW